MTTGTQNHVLIGTAGHIDHGKTSLVHALTGFETDRLPEEKRRGISIVLGFAPMTLSDGRIVGLVDVPGHERFVKQMAAGAGGIDVVLLVVAANEGIRPQTREHVDVCTLLGVRLGVIALTKCDRSESPSRVMEDLRREFAGTFLDGAPLVPCSATQGIGIEEVRSALTNVVSRVEARAHGTRPFLPIDRVFNRRGVGTVVTGTLLRGEISVGQAVEVVPAVSGQELSRPAEIRSIEVFWKRETTAYAGQRVALNLQGVSKEQLQVGQLLTSVGGAKKTRTLAVELAGPDLHRPGPGTVVQIVVGTASTRGRVIRLTEPKLQPGGRDYALLRLETPVAAFAGQRCLLRGFEDPKLGPGTLAGGLILDPEPYRYRRGSEETRSAFEILSAHLHHQAENAPPLDVVAEVLARSYGIRGLGIADISRRLNFTQIQEQELRALLEHSDRASLLNTKNFSSSGSVISKGSLERTTKALLEALHQLHEDKPFRAGFSLPEIGPKLGIKERAVLEALRDFLVHTGDVIVSEGLLQRPQRTVQNKVDALRARMTSLLEAGDLQPPSTEEIAGVLSMDSARVREALAECARIGSIVKAGREIYFGRTAFDRATQRITTFFERNTSLDMTQAKALFPVSRKYLIPLLESMDRAGITRRDKTLRRPGIKFQAR